MPDLADAAGLGVVTTMKFEAGRGGSERTINALTVAIEGAGVEILNSDAPGARLRPIKSKRRNKR